MVALDPLTLASQVVEQQLDPVVEHQVEDNATAANSPTIAHLDHQDPQANRALLVKMERLESQAPPETQELERPTIVATRDASNVQQDNQELQDQMDPQAHQDPMDNRADQGNQVMMDNRVAQDQLVMLDPQVDQANQVNQVNQVPRDNEAPHCQAHQDLQDQLAHQDQLANQDHRHQPVNQGLQGLQDHQVNQANQVDLVVPVRTAMLVYQGPTPSTAHAPSVLQSCQSPDKEPTRVPIVLESSNSREVVYDVVGGYSLTISIGSSDWRAKNK